MNTDPSTDAYIPIGQIVAPRGLGGELKVAMIAEPEQFLALRRVYLGEGLTPFEVEQARLFHGQALLRLRGIADRDAAEAWREAIVYMLRQDATPLAEGEYYYRQIEGLTVLTAEGENLGQVVEIIATGANDVYVVRGSSGEILLPAIRQVILRVDLQAGTLLVKLLEGLR